ncbi:MAG: DUF885 family protein [Deltaproteobacteria bacterium]|nr:DUF885 family protein [Deltaproteobacteria bacterium]
MRMKNRRLLAVVAGLVVAGACSTNRPSEEPAAEAVVRAGDQAGWPELSDSALRLLWEIYPSRATALGVHGYGGRLPTRDGVALKRTIDRVTSSVQLLYALEPTELTPDERVDRQLLIAELRLALHEFAIDGRPLVSPLEDIEELAAGLQALWLDDGVALEDRVALATERLLQVPPYLQAVRANAHAPAGRLCQAALVRAQETRRFIEDELRPIGERVERGLRDRFDVAADEAGRAIDAFVGALGPICGQRPELLPIGADSYRIHLRYRHGVALGAAEVIAFAEQWLQRSDATVGALPALPAAAAPLSPEFDRRALFELMVRQAAALRAQVFERSLVMTQPVAVPLRALELPPLLQGRAPALALWPGPAFGRSGALLLTSIAPATVWSPAEREQLRRFVASSAFALWTARETYPGRLLQQTLARRQASSVRRAHRSSMLGDGWALYAMRVALDSGLVVGDETARRVLLEEVRAAAARAIVDAKLHTGALTFDEAVRFLADHTALPQTALPVRDRLPALRAEVLQIAQAPAQAAGALLGKVALDELRDRGRAARGAQFVLGRFHDALLSAGSIPTGYIAHLLFGDALPELDPFVAPGAAEPDAVSAPAAPTGD